MSTIKTFTDGEIIIKEGDEGKTFFQLLEGKAKVYRDYEEDDQVEVATLEEGQYFGEMAVIENFPRNSTVVADGDVKVDEIAAEELNEYIAQNPDKILAIMKVLGSRIQKMDEEFIEVKKARDEIRKAGSDSRYDGFWARQQRLSIYMSPKAAQLERPSAEELRQAAEAVSRQKGGNIETYNYGTLIFKQGEIGKCMYILHEGNVCVYKNYGEKDELKLTSVDPVACFGEIGMLLEEPRNATAAVETSGTQIEVIYPEDLAELFKTNPERIDMIMKNLSYRLRSITYEYCKACQEIAEAEAEAKSRRR
jgi:CRP-like cAMP-binding protein